MLVYQRVAMKIISCTINDQRGIRPWAVENMPPVTSLLLVAHRRVLSGNTQLPQYKQPEVQHRVSRPTLLIASLSIVYVCDCVCVCNFNIDFILVCKKVPCIKGPTAKQEFTQKDRIIAYTYIYIYICIFI